MKAKASHILLQQPELVDRREDKVLLIWSEMAQWMLVDEEAHDFIAAFAQARKPAQVVKAHAQRWHKPLALVEREAKALLDAMRVRGLLGPTAPPPPDKPSLANITFNISNHCNLRCPWCYNQERKGAEVDIETVVAALHEARPSLDPDASLIVLGGEPFLQPARLLQLFRACDRLFRQPFLVSSNGTRMDPETAAALAELPVEVQLSIDSADPSKHDAARGEGVHARAMQTLRLLREAGVPVILSMVYRADNLEDFLPMLELGAEQGASEVRFIPLRAIGSGTRYREQLPNQFMALQHLLRCLDARPELARLLARDYFGIASHLVGRAQRQVNCGLGRRVLFIDADGGIYPCPNHVSPELRAGKLGREPLHTVLTQSPVFRQVRERFHLSQYSRCRSCPFRRWCAGDCRGEVLSLGGTAADPSPHCGELRKMYLELMWRLATGTSPWRRGAELQRH